MFPVIAAIPCMLGVGSETRKKREDEKKEEK